MRDQAVQEVAIDKLVCRPQVRRHFGEEELAGLAQSIRENGILQPLLAHRKGTAFILDDGERRLRAAKKAGLATVPVIVDDRELCRAEVVQRQLVANCQRADLSPMEKASAIERLLSESRMSAAQAAVKLGMSPAQISKLLKLLELPADTQQQVAIGALAPSSAYEIARVSDEQQRLRLAEEAVNGGLTRTHISGKCKAARSNGVRRRSRRCHDQVLMPLGSGRSVMVRGAGITLDALVNWIEELLTKIRSASAGGVALADFIKSLPSK